MKNFIKNNIIIITVAILLTVILILLFSAKNIKKENMVDYNNLRIVSLSPSITEYLYDIGMQDKLIANTVYCKYPEDAENKLKIGSFNDINYEYIERFKINTAVIQKGMDEQKKRLTDMGVRVIEINNNTIDDIIKTYDILGDAFNIQKVTDAKKEKLINDIESIKKRVNKGTKQKAVISIFRNYGEKVTSLTVSGGNNMYNDILEILNLENPFKDEQPYPEISIENIIRENPDIIIDLYHGRSTISAQKDWEDLKMLKAVKNNKLYILNDVYLSLPGPRTAEIIKKFADTVYGTK